MSLKFVNQPGTWNEHQETIRFPAFDGSAPVMCAISLNALEDLTRSSNLTPEQCVAAFAKHRKRIEQKASALYALGRVNPEGVVLVKTADLA
jgi:Protein of unknown function (DUF1488)